jgi:hypothetical protein
LQVPEKLAQHKKVAAVEENDDGDDGREAAYDQVRVGALPAAAVLFHKLVHCVRI